MFYLEKHSDFVKRNSSAEGEKIYFPRLSTAFQKNLSIFKSK